MKHQRKNISLQDSAFGPTDPHLEELTAVQWADVVSCRIDLGLRLHQHWHDVRKPNKLSPHEFALVLKALEDAQREFAACLKALAWSTPLTIEDIEAQHKPASKRPKKLDSDLPHPDRLEPYADGTMRGLEQLRKQLGLRQFQAIEYAQCSIGMSQREFDYLKQTTRACQMFYAIRIEELNDFNAWCLHSARGTRGKRRMKSRVAPR